MEAFFPVNRMTGIACPNSWKKTVNGLVIQRMRKIVRPKKNKKIIKQ
jgi:hypothetical protein